MDIFDKLLEGVRIPAFAPVHFEIEHGTIVREDIAELVEKEILQKGLLSAVKEGDTVAVTAGSRGITNYDQIVKCVVDVLKKAGAHPFIFPAMGSHGGAVAEGQRRILEGYGITEETMGVPIVSSMETVQIGETPHGLPVHMDKNAAVADFIVPVGRVKPHTDFRGRHESGLYKMLAIGCGKQHGADICHSRGYGEFSRNIAEIAEVMLQKKKILFGMAIVEDAFHGTYSLTAVPPERFEEEDARLLVKAKELIPHIPFEKVNVLVLNRFGKNISGAGMDPNVTGRSGSLPVEKPFIDRIVVLDLTEESHNNFAGIGIADVITQRFYSKIDFKETYPNGITSRDLASLKIPTVMKGDRNAVRAALQTVSGKMPKEGWHVVWMQDTLGLENFLISESLVEEARLNPALSVGTERIVPEFDRDGNLQGQLFKYLHES